MITVNNSADLLDVIVNERPEGVELARGEYEIELPDTTPRYLNLIEGREGYTEIRLKNTLHVAHKSSAWGVTWKPLGNFAALNLDRAAYAHFHYCTFATQLELGGHIGAYDWSQYPHEGIGVETTLANDGDNTYWILLDNCKFIGLTAGIRAGQAGLKALNELRVRDCEFDRCEVAFEGLDVGNTKMRDCAIQLARVGLDIHGNNNKCEARIERCATAIALRGDSYYNDFHTAGIVAVNDETGEFNPKSKEGKKVSRGKQYGNVFVMEATKHI
jgi:hypothetical protein